MRPEPPPVIHRRDPPPRPAPPAVPPAPPPPRRPAPPPRPVTPKAKRQKSKRRWGRRIALTLLIVVILVGAGVVGGTVWLDASLHRVSVFTAGTDRPAPGRGTNWLLVGSDSRQDLTDQQQEELATGGDMGTGRTDTILLVHVPAFDSSNPTTLVSIPRDSYVPIPGHGKDKINSAFTTGGPTLLAQTVEQATGLRLDHYIEIGFTGFAGMVDALGGITVCPSSPINDPLAGIDLPAGCQELTGRNALGFVRSRATPRADLDRMINQRQAMSALMQRAASPAVWLNPWRWYTVSHAVVNALLVDRDDHAWNLARLGLALRGNTRNLTVPIGEFTNGDVGSVVVWNHDAASKLFDALAADAEVPAEVVDEQP